MHHSSLISSLSSNHRNSRLRGVVSSPPCLSMPSSWPISAAAGPSTCSSSVSLRILRKSLVSPSARFGFIVSLYSQSADITMTNTSSLLSPECVKPDRWGSCLLSPTWWWQLWFLLEGSWLTSCAVTKSCLPQMWENSWTVEVCHGKGSPRRHYIRNLEIYLTLEICSKYVNNMLGCFKLFG